MPRVLTAPKADTLSLEVGSADVRIVVGELRKNVAVTLDASGPQSEEAANKATLVGGKLTVPPITGTTVFSNRGMVSNGGGTVQVDRFGGRNVVIGGASGIASEHLTVTVRIPKGVLVTAAIRGGDINVAGPLANANLYTRGGDITVSGLLANAYLRTEAGNIHVHAVEGATVLQTNGGNVIIDRSSGVVQATTSGGNVRARRVTGAAVLTTSGGNIYAYADYPAMLSANSSGGNITIAGRYDRTSVTASTSGGSVSFQ